MWALSVLFGLWLFGVAAGMWLRLGIYLWACQRFQHQDPVRLAQMCWDRPLPPPPDWYAEENRKFSAQPSDVGV